MSGKSGEESKALAGLRIVELGHGIAGPFGSRLLADLGADVVKVEPPEGEFGRRLSPLAADEDGGVKSLLFDYLNWNKRSVVIDLRKASASEKLAALVTEADIVIESFRPGRLDGWGFGFQQLKRWNAGIVLVSVSNFGQNGKAAQDEASDLIFYALSGLSSISGFKDPESPVKHGLRQGLYGAGMTVAYSALAAHRLSRRSGAAQHVDLSILECLASEMVAPCAYYSFAGAVQGRHPQPPDPLEGMPLRTKSGFVSFQINSRAPIAGVAELLGDPDLGDKRNGDGDYRVLNASSLKASVEKSLASRPANEWFISASQRGLLAGVVQGAEQLLGCPQLESRELFRTIPRGGHIRYPLELARLSKSPASVRLPAPRLDEHGTELLGDNPKRDPRPLSFARHKSASSDMSGDSARGPLHGIRVVELASLISVPYVGSLLADLGAEVIKIEGPQRMDPLRYSFGPLLENKLGSKPWNRAGSFYMLNRGKKSFVCDLTSAKGQQLLRKLIAESDVLIENFSPSVMRKWGLTPDALETLNPRLISMSNSGFGSTGPWRDFKAQGTTLELTMGAAAYTGYEGGPPLKAGQSYPDFLACWSAMTAILASLAHRDVTGRGQHIDQGMYQLGPCVIPEALLHYQHDGTDCGRHGAQDFEAYLSGVFELANGEGWIAISLADGAAVPRLGQAIPALKSVACMGVDEARTIIASWIRTKDADSVTQAFRAAGVAVGRVNSTSDLFKDERLRSRGFFEEVSSADPEIGTVTLIGRPFLLVGAEGAARARGCAPDFGQHNDEVLKDILDLDDAKIAELISEGVVADRPLDVSVFKPIDFETRIQKGQFDRLDKDFRSICKLAEPREPWKSSAKSQ